MNLVDVWDKEKVPTQSVNTAGDVDAQRCQADDPIKHVDAS